MINIIIIGLLTIICYVVSQFVKKGSKIWWGFFIITLLLLFYNIYLSISNLMDKNKVMNTVYSSTINANIKISVNNDVKHFYGTIASISSNCYLITKSSQSIQYITDPGTLKMKRGNRKYIFILNAKLLPEKNPLRYNYEEFKNAKRIEIPLISFIKLIKKNHNINVNCELKEISIQYYLNGKLLIKKTYPCSANIDESKNSTVYLDI